MSQWYPNLPPSGSVKGLSNPFLSQFGDVGFGVCGGGGSLMAKGKFGAALGSDDVFSDTKNMEAVVPAPISEFTQKLLAGGQALNYVNSIHAYKKWATPVSDMGIFNKLPGELRNRIYIYSVVAQDKVIKVTAKHHEDCSEGRCRHTKASYNLPGLLSTCRQIRAECAMIYFTENKTILFDQDVVHFRCVGNYIRSIGHYIHPYMQYKFMMYRPVFENNEFLSWAPYTFTLGLPTPPKFLFEMYQQPEDNYVGEPTRRLLCSCVLNNLLEEMAENLGGSFKHDPFIDNPYIIPYWVDFGQYLIDFFDSDKFDNFVFQVRKTETNHTEFELCVYCEDICFRPDALMSSWW
ncbi:hypothetical protein BST61_g2869 [Cercospora zeina]